MILSNRPLKIIEILRHAERVVSIEKLMELTAATRRDQIMSALPHVRDILRDENLYLGVQRKAGYYITPDANKSSARKERPIPRDRKNYVEAEDEDVISGRHWASGYAENFDPLLAALKKHHTHGRGDYPGYRSYEELSCPTS